MTGLARIDLEHLRGGATPVHQLTLVDQLVRLCSRTSPPPRAISTAKLLHPSRPPALGDPIHGAPARPGRNQPADAYACTPKA